MSSIVYYSFGINEKPKFVVRLEARAPYSEGPKFISLSGSPMLLLRLIYGLL